MQAKNSATRLPLYPLAGKFPYVYEISLAVRKLSTYMYAITYKYEERIVMNKIALALALTLATAGFAAAAETAPKRPVATATQTATTAKPKLDTVKTGSIGNADTAKPRLGYDGNPWVITGF